MNYSYRSALEELVDAGLVGLKPRLDGGAGRSAVVKQEADRAGHQRLVALSSGQRREPLSRGPRGPDRRRVKSVNVSPENRGHAVHSTFGAERDETSQQLAYS
jgi:hypothetical protein